MNSIDMTKGKPFLVILKFSIPVFLGAILQQIYNITDAIIVGQFIGTLQLAAVGSTSAIMFIFYGFTFGMTAGFVIAVAQYFGAKDYDNMRKSVICSTVLTLIIGVVVTLIGVIFMDDILVLLNTPENIYKDAYDYIIIICIGLIAQMLFNLLLSILRAVGNSKVPLYFFILSTVLNVVIDIFLIFTFDMGVNAVALGTVLSQFIAGFFTLIYIIIKVPILHIKKEDFKFDFSIYLNILQLGLPMALQYFITSIGKMMVQSSLNLLGPTYIAAVTAGNKVEQIVTQGSVALGVGIAIFVAQNKGANNIKRIREGFRAVTIMGIIYYIVIMIFHWTVAKYTTYLFITDDINILMNDIDIYLKAIALFFIPLSIVDIYRSGLHGLGFGFLPLFSGIAELIGRGAMAIISEKTNSYLAICLASPIAWICADILLLITYFFLIKIKYKKELK